MSALAAAEERTTERDAQLSGLQAPTVPALVVGHVSHTRYRPIRDGFRYRHYQWLVDLDDLPEPRGPMRLLARFDPRDHLAGAQPETAAPGAAIRADLERFLADSGRTLDPTDRVLMLAHARVLGHTFDPLTVFWCIGSDGRCRAVVLEVHNTYGGRHAYVLDPDEHGRGEVDKAFYVSPFNDTSGRYTVRVVLRPDKVAVSVGLARDGARVMTASTTGTVMPATRRNVLAVAGRYLLMTYRVSLLIRWHGIRLWARRLAVQPRPPDVGANSLHPTVPPRREEMQR